MYQRQRDDGFSGTNTEHRMGFQQMRENALAGKFEFILIKSVSRLPRNLTDCIKHVKEMQNLDPPVDLQFEQRNFSMLSQTSSVILFVPAMAVQEENYMKKRSDQSFDPVTVVCPAFQEASLHPARRENPAEDPEIPPAFR